MSIINATLLEGLKNFPEDYFSAVVTDPPYGISFMNNHWDYRVPSVADWTEVLRVLKPGGFLLSFGGTRTYHRLVVNIEDAGFEIRDQLQWIYGSGFPKSLDISKAIDKAAGINREIIGVDASAVRKNAERNHQSGQVALLGLRARGSGVITAPSTDNAKLWSGWGTALKPANEPICMARKPISEQTVAANVLRHGTGGIYIDGCRIDFVDDGDLASATFGRGTNILGGNYVGATHPSGKINIPANAKGRWPSNVILDESSAIMMDKQSGELASGAPGIKQSDNSGFSMGKESRPAGTKMSGFGDSGGASRFFYCAKASRSERNRGLEAFPTRPLIYSSGDANPGSFQSDGTNKNSQNHHPTVKPVKLMQYLVRLIAPPGGIVLDPFAGSGTTGIACKLEEREYVLIEKEKEFCDIASARIDGWEREVDDNSNQLDLFSGF